jgi:hypothetical protein
VLAARYGTRLTRRSKVFLDYEVYGEPDAEMRMDYFFWVARSPERIVLIDCGFNERSGARRDVAGGVRLHDDGSGRRGE